MSFSLLRKDSIPVVQHPSDTKIVDDSDTGLYSDSIRTIHRPYSDYIQTILGLDIDYIQTIHLQYNIYTIAYNLSNLTRVSSTKLLLPAINNTYLYILSGFILHILYIRYGLTQSGYTRDVSFQNGPNYLVWLHPRRFVGEFSVTQSG